MTTVTVNEEIIALTEEVVETITVTVAEQGPPGVDADHSGLLNLDADDHAQYHNDARGDARYSPLAHDHSGVYEPADADIQSHLISTANPHSVTAAQVGADATGTAAGLIATHESAVNPHPGYLTHTEGDAAYAALSHDHSGVYEASGSVSTHAAVTSSVHGITTFGASLVDDADAGTARNTLGLGTAATTAATDYATAAHNHTGTYDPAGTASSAVSSHEGAADPHPGYALESSLGSAALLSVGTTTGTVAAGDDARFSTGTTGDAFASSHPGGNQHIDWTADQGATNLHAGNIPDLSGTYAVTAKGVTNGDSHDHSGGDGAQIAYSGLSGLPTLGTAAATAATDYATAAQGATADTAVQPGDDAADLGSGSATDGYVLTADGAGGAAWEAVPDAYAGAASEIHAATEKTTPVDADELGLVDSAASWVLKRLTWANVKATLAGVFPLLAGKSGGQTLIGGTGATDKLVLQGTSGNGTSTATALEVKVGNNGLVTGLSVDNTGILTVNSGINFSQVTAPTAPGLTILAVAGNVPVGLHRYLVTYVTDIGETQRGGVSTVTIAADSQQVQMTVPVSTDSRVKSRYLYRDDNNYVFKRIAILADNTTTNYIDNNASGDTNNNIWYSPNTTNKIFVYNGTSKILVANTSVTSFGEGALAAAGLSIKEIVAVGTNAGGKTTTGASNTHLGYNAGYGVTTGIGGCFVGSYAGGITHSTSHNTFIGSGAGHNNAGSISGNYNVSIGSASGGGGSGNSSLGNTASNMCVVIGRFAGFASTTTMTNSIAIGYDCLVDKSNQAILGNSSITETILRGTVYITKTTEQLRLGYDATNYVSATVSSTGNLTLDTTGGTIYTPDTIENTVAGGGIILKSPDGTRYRITVANGGTLTVATA